MTICPQRAGTLEALVDIFRRGASCRFSNYRCGNTCGCYMCGHVLHYHAAGPDLGTFTNFDISNNRGRCANQNILSNLGMTISLFLAGSPERYSMLHRNVIVYNCGFTYDNTGRVVEHDAATDFCRRVDINTENCANLILEVKRKAVPILAP